MNVLVTGATGFVGRAVCRALIAYGSSVTAAVRTMSGDILPECDVIEVGDIDAQTNWSGMLESVDAVVHLAARTHTIDNENSLAAYWRINVDGTSALARAAADAGVQRFIYMSSVKVNGEKSAQGDDGIMQRFGGADEPHPTTDYGRTKWEAEKRLVKIVVDSPMVVVILRPPLVYGPGQKANMHRLMRLVDHGIPLPFARLNNSRSLIYVENLAGAVVRAVEADIAGLNTYTLADIDVSTATLIRALADALGKPARLFPLPVGTLRLLARLMGRSDQMDKLTNSLIVEHQRIRDELSWTPRYSFAQALVDTVAWYRTSGADR